MIDNIRRCPQCGNLTMNLVDINYDGSRWWCDKCGYLEDDVYYKKVRTEYEWKTSEWKPCNENVVEVIRCRDCKHHFYHDLLKQDYCEITNMQFGEVEPNGYCHRAERKDE